MIDLKAIRAAAEAATKGEWVWQEGTPVISKHWNGHDRAIAIACVDWRALALHEDDNCAGHESGANAKHIATANPSTVLEMVSMIRGRDAQVAQLQEQNTHLDKVASDLQDLCDRQAKALGERDAVLRQALEALESQKAYIEASEPGLVTDVPAIAAIKEVLK